MKRVDSRVLLDACVLAPANLGDLLLSLAEAPRLYLPIWSEEILAEVRRTQRAKLNWPEQLVDLWQREMRRSFPEALVSGYEPLMASCQNHEGDRHVLATAIRAGAGLIVTSNLRHFADKHLEPLGIVAKSPGDFLSALYDRNAAVFVAKLTQIARRRGRTPQDVLARVGKTLPRFATRVAAKEKWELSKV